MRTKRTLSAPRAAQLVAGAVILALPSSAYALAGTGGRTPSHASATRPARVRTVPTPWPPRIAVPYGHDVVLTGRAVPAAGRSTVTLQYEAAGSVLWQGVASARPGPERRFTLRGPIERSGLLRIIEAAAGRFDGVAPAATMAAAGEVAESHPSHVAVAAEFHVANGTIDGVAGAPSVLTGRLLPGSPGRIVRLLAGDGPGWTTLAQARTGATGRFSLTFTAPRSGTDRLRVAFAGDRANGGATASAGEAVGYTESVASWYYDGGSTACGFHATYGIANRTLPCGTHVTLSFGGRSVVATVDDRGPFVAGREYDLNQNTAAALGMHGVATVLAAV